MSSFYVYIMTNKPNGTLYIGSTTDLIKRVWVHKNKFYPTSFTVKYSLNRLVYYEVHKTYIEAARREKRFKKWPRHWKINLIKGMNASWSDLYEIVTCV